MNLLFVCTKNQWRSLTAEHLYRNNPLYQVRSAGTASDARRRIDSSDIKWADLIFVMEKKHQEILQNKFPNELQGKRIVCLNIPDEYVYMDEELVQMLKDSVEEYL